MESNVMQNMRVALELCIYELDCAIHGKFAKDAEYLVGCIMVQIARMKEALEMLNQKRNCDVFETSDSAIDYWNNNSKLLQGLAVFTIDGEQYHNIVEWLYAKKNDKKVEGADK